MLHAKVIEIKKEKIEISRAEQFVASSKFGASIFFNMKIKLELFGSSRDLSNKDYLEFNIDEKISIKELRQKLINYVDDKFKGNDNFKKIIETSAFCSEDNNIVSDNYKITNDKKIGLIPPIGGG